MDYLGISCHIKNKPSLDSGFIPFAPWQEAYLTEAHRPVRIAVERQDGQVAVFDTRLRDEPYRAADLRFLERTVKLLLWSVGGWRVRICGCDELTEALRHIYCRGGDRAFDADFMETVFQRPFVLEAVSEADFPVPHSGARRIGGAWRLPKLPARGIHRRQACWHAAQQPFVHLAILPFEPELSEEESKRLARQENRDCGCACRARRVRRGGNGGCPVGE